MSMARDSNVLREQVLTRLRRQIRQRVRQGHPPEEIDRLLVAREREISTAERELGFLLTRAESSNEVRERYFAQVAESYD
jgi:hypothetical protein